ESGERLQEHEELHEYDLLRLWRIVPSPAANHVELPTINSERPFIQTNIISSQTVMVSEYNDGKSLNKEQLYFEDFQVTVSLELLGVEFSQHQTRDGVVTITAYLTEDSVPQYSSKLLMIKQNIESLEARNTNEVDLFSKKQNLLLLLRYYEDFESYATIISTLSSNFGLPILTNTKAGAQLDYLLLLKQERDQLQIELDEVTNPSLASEAMQQQAQIRLLAIRKQIEQNRQEEMLLRDAQLKQQEKLMELADISIKQSVEAMSQRAQSMIDSFIKRNENVDEQLIIQRIEEQKQAYAKIQLDLETAYETQAANIEKEYQKRVSNLENSSYRIAEMVNGLPTDYAKELRNTQINEMVKEKEQELESLRLSMENSVQPQLDTIMRMIISEYKQLEATDFLLQSIQDAVQVRIGNYDGHRKSWPIAIRFSVLDSQLAFDYYVPYEAITGNPLPNFEELNANDYAKYLDQVDLYETYLLTTENPIFVEVKYKISPYGAASEYYIIPEMLEIKRADTSKMLVEISNTELIVHANSYVFRPSTNLDFSYSSSITKAIEKGQQQEIHKIDAQAKKKIRDKLNVNKNFSKYAVGLNLGTNTGVGVQYRMNDFDIVGNLGFGFLDGYLSFDVAANYKVTEFEIEKAKFDVTVGGGAYVGIPIESGAKLGLAAIAPVGVMYSLDNNDVPLDFYLRIAPGLWLLPDVSFHFSGYVGALWRFN
ncbi:hypothetical protein, partial [Sphaerochaeta sp.]|uniref:hypothetical protein n=1 Tax=Sphaerochaeta sp. TaxID=1972642 RepID=UPI00258F4422